MRLGLKIEITKCPPKSFFENNEDSQISVSLKGGWLLNDHSLYKKISFDERELIIDCNPFGSRQFVVDYLSRCEELEKMERCFRDEDKLNKLFEKRVISEAEYNKKKVELAERAAQLENKFYIPNKVVIE